MNAPRLIFADNNATTAVAPEVVAAMQPFFGPEYFNPSSMYEPALKVAGALKAARRTVAEFLGGAEPAEVVFTSCATESNNAAIFGVAAANPARRHILTSRVEHPAVLEVCREMQRRGWEVTYLPVDRQGQIATADFVRALRPDTLLVSLMHANNETGVVWPVADWARIAKETDREIVFHTDATQTAGKLPLDLAGEMQHVDLLSFSGHKMHAPKGVGALFVRRGTRLRPFLLGGHQESGRRGGTENVAFIVGLARACELAREHAADMERIARLRDGLEADILRTVTHVEVNGHGVERTPNTLNLACHFIEGESILYELMSHGICASTGSACSSGSLEPSHVLRAMDVPFTAMHGSVRLSFSAYTAEADVRRIAEVFPRVVADLRKLSPFWDQKHNRPRDDA
ncbi:MAG: aminotransferase class V-fold PLP-dependent enzyme [Kiritimatiellae bacterium]|nr:aminotransferase class V-fold PLP-dependent enzyme [Kiritimatiellia bacterium]NLD89208.1 aminotransferase class V-fold PLP-dependent enzyme [Lentisphaerota bacterium]HPC20403.1 aminotransferase class V-fold PLP-dependent enzyme [Kiritimatiellia bacterium]HQN80482.1 aminotransferase class V-fold PLP-dependent enzyme [Kiritimatiellia bacterium]